MNSDARLGDVLRVLVKKKGLINDGTPSIDVFDLDYFEARMKQLNDAFPESFFNHALALKANSMRTIIKHALDKGKMGAECASICEVMHAVNSGFPAEKVVYDSPCKSKVDLKTALDLGVVINLDNDVEMEVVDQLLAEGCGDGKKRVIGLRINPVVGGGTISIFNTATKLSKFGLPLTDKTEGRLLELYERYEWLNGVHFHVGSQGVPLDLFVSAAKIVLGFVAKVESHCQRDLDTIDIGGGLSTSYTEASEPDGFDYRTYRKRLEEAVPTVFSGKYKVITEFGRSLVLKAGKTITRIETIKQWLPDVQPILLTHVGSNQFVRETYAPHVYQHRIDVATADGELKVEGRRKVYDVAGPLCFQGDYLKRDVELFEVGRHDLLVIHDTGGYSMAMYSRYNSIVPSPVYAFGKNEDGNYRVVCVKERETPEETLAFWGSRDPRPV